VYVNTYCQEKKKKKPRKGRKPGTSMEALIHDSKKEEELKAAFLLEC